MPVTVTYDIAGPAGNHHAWLRSMLERFGFRRLGGSVFRYQGTDDGQEDWMNHVAPALMLFRSHVLHHGITLSRFTVDAHSVAFFDHSDSDAPVGAAPHDGNQLVLSDPTNPQAGEQSIRDFVTACTAGSP